MPSSDGDPSSPAPRSPANRLGLDYRAAPPRVLGDWPIIDVHTHVHACRGAALFLEAADRYGVERIVSMSPLEEVRALLSQYARRLEFIAVPRWRQFNTNDVFRDQWRADLEAFRDFGARVMKLWSAPPLRGEFGLTLEHEFFGPVIRDAIDLGYSFMVHVADPSEWWKPGGRYANAERYGTKRDQFAQLEFLLELVSPRTVIGAHMGGSIEDLEFLQQLLDKHENLHLDTSATKWVVREIARQPEQAREFVIRNSDRVLFGTDLVVDEAYDFDHYASRLWSHQTLWETGYRGESPIEDPDAADPPVLAGLALPPAVLRAIYRDNACRLGFGEA